MFKTITARFAGSKCRRCNQAIQVGTKFRYGGRGNCWHLSKECPANLVASAPAAQDEGHWDREAAHDFFGDDR